MQSLACHFPLYNLLTLLKKKLCISFLIVLCERIVNSLTADLKYKQGKHRHLPN